MEDYPQILRDEELYTLEKANEIWYFRYIDREVFNSVKDQLTPREIDKLTKGDSHAIVGSALYCKISSHRENKLVKVKSIEKITIDEDGALEILADCFYVPKGREYRLVDKNFIPPTSSFEID